MLICDHWAWRQIFMKKGDDMCDWNDQKLHDKDKQWTMYAIVISLKIQLTHTDCNHKARDKKDLRFESQLKST